MDITRVGGGEGGEAGGGEGGGGLGSLSTKILQIPG